MRRGFCRRVKPRVRPILLGSMCCGVITSVMAQKPIAPTMEELSPVAAKVDVTPVAQDEDIRKRLQTALNATDWFTDPQVRVEEGVVSSMVWWSPMS